MSPLSRRRLCRCGSRGVSRRLLCLRRCGLLALISIFFGCPALWAQGQFPTLVVSGSGSTTDQTTGDYYGSYNSTPFTLDATHPSPPPTDNFTVTGSFSNSRATVSIQGQESMGQHTFNGCPYSPCTFTWTAGATLNISLQGTPGTPYQIYIIRSASLSTSTGAPIGVYTASTDSATVSTSNSVSPIPSTSYSTVGTITGTGQISTQISVNAGLDFRLAYCNSDLEGCLPTFYPGGGATQVNYTVDIVASVGGPTTNKQPPVAVIQAPKSSNLNAPVSLDGSQSYDPDGSVVAYNWTIQKPGGADILSGPTLQYTWTQPGTYQVILTVTDNDGQTGITSQSVSVATPTILILNPYACVVDAQNCKGAALSDVLNPTDPTSILSAPTATAISADGLSAAVIAISTGDAINPIQVSLSSSGFPGGSIGSLAPYDPSFVTAQSGVNSGSTSLTIQGPTTCDAFGNCMFRALLWAPINMSGGNLVAGVYQSIPLTVTATQNGSIVGPVQITLQPPPLVLVHGIWSTADAWSQFIPWLNMNYPLPQNFISTADYGQYSSLGFSDPNIQKVLERAILDSLATANESPQGVVARQVDIVAHSMGGLVSRYFIKQNPASNSVHHLVTIGTPQLGSPLASLLWDNKNTTLSPTSAGVSPLVTAVCRAIPSCTLGNFFAAIHKPVTTGVQSLIPGNQVTGGQVYDSILGQAPDPSFSGIILNGIILSFVPPNTVDGVLGAGNDTIVGASSQDSGAASRAAIQGIVHTSLCGPCNTGETVSQPVWSQAAYWLMGGSGTAPAQITATTVTNLGIANATQQSTAPSNTVPLLDLTGYTEIPASNLTFSPTTNSTLTINVPTNIIATSSAKTITEILLFQAVSDPTDVPVLYGPQSLLSIPFTPVRLGSTSFTAFAVFSDMTFAVVPLNYTFQVSGSPSTLKLTNAPVASMRIGSSAIVGAQALFSNGTVDVSQAATFKVRSGQTNVFVVDSTGLVTANGAGTDWLDVSYGGVNASAQISVGSCTFSLSPANQYVDYSGGSVSVQVTTQSGCAWTADTGSAAWLTPNNTSGNGSGAITLTAASNTAGTTKTARITVANQGATVIQPAMACTYSLSQTQISAPTAGGTGTIGVTTNCPIVVSSDSSWLVPTATSNAVNYSVAANTSSSTRSATLTISNQTVLVTQATLPATSTIVASSLNPSVVGQSVTFVSTVIGAGGTPTGSVTFYDGTTSLGTRELNGGSATFSSSGLAAGSHSITAQYNGQVNFAASTPSPALAQVVTGLATSTAVVSSATPTVVGQAIIFTATVTATLPNTGAPTGGVTFFDGSIVLGTGVLNAGKAIFSTSSLMAGTHLIAAQYGGDATFSGSTSASVLAQVVNKANTTIFVMPSANPAVAGQTVTLTSTVSVVAPGAGSPTGTVTFLDGGNLLGLSTITAANIPGARYRANAWTDVAGNFWLFGGNGYDLAGSQGLLNDLWMYSAGQWTWMGGSNAVNQNGTYGIQGMPVPSNVPGARFLAVNWTDAAGNVWMFGGTGYDSTGTSGELNDLWEFSAGLWTWMGGSNIANQSGTYGTQGAAAPGNIPGARLGAATWSDTAGIFWLFGGSGYDSAGTFGQLNDLWKFSAGQWTWMGGSNIANQTGTYGSQGTTAQSNTPGARLGAVTWTDSAGTVWLFGGSGFDSAGTFGQLNDLWKYSGGQWTWMGGSKIANQPGAYGTQSSSAPGNIPGARNFGRAWTDTAGNFWLFGGSGYDSAGKIGQLNDLWKYSAGQWTWMSGSNMINERGAYGSQGMAAAGNIPGARTATFSWSDAAGNLWLYGGRGYDSAGTLGLLNDLWKYNAGQWTWVGGSNISNQSGQAMAAVNNATFTTSLLAAGSHSITASYSGDANFTPSNSAPLIETVTPPVLAASSTVLISSASPTLLGQSVIFTATVTSTKGTPTGTVTFFDGATSLGAGPLSTAGIATLSTSSLTAGSHSITAKYNGDSDFGTSISTTLTQLVTGLASVIALNSSLNPSAIGQSVTFTATVTSASGTPTGTVTFFDGTTSLGIGTISPANTPGARLGGARWTDLSGNFWLFGGNGYDSAVFGGELNDLWKYSAGQWTWMGGATLGGQKGTYGTQGTAAAGNVPGGRDGAVNWIDAAGNFWVFGGEGLDSASRVGELNDLWKYSAGQWTWMGGSNVVNQKGTYGTQGTAAPGNIPGARLYAVAWTDPDGNFWLFGGLGYDSAGAQGELNDLWKYSAGQWTWMGGSNVVNQKGAYGTQGTAAPGNIPGARHYSGTWIDAAGNLWLFGGLGWDSGGTSEGDLDDLWKFSAGQWTWMGGSNVNKQKGTYGTQGTAAPSNIPGARGVGLTWTDRAGNFWLFGGGGYDSLGTVGQLNDLWKFSAGQWTWMGGPNIANQSGTYGTSGMAGPTNIPGARANGFAWTDAAGNLWLFGGSGWDSTGTGHGDLNDMWKYGASQWTWMGGSNVVAQNGTYGIQDTAGGGPTLTISSLAAGSHSITAQYSGDANFAPSTSAVLTQYVLAPSTLILTSSPNPAGLGQPVTFTATVMGTGGSPTGSVTFYDGTTSLGAVTLASGKATLLTSNLTIGTHSITAQYGGDSTFSGTTSSPALTQAVTGNKSSTTALTSSPNPEVAGQSVTFSAKVTSAVGGIPTGTVTFFNGSTALGTGSVRLDVSGVATLSTTALALGSPSITASYSGDANYVASTAPALIETVNVAGFAPSPTGLTVTAGQNLPINLTLYSAAGSGLNFTLDCEGNPQKTTCSFGQNPVAPAAPPNGTTVQLTLGTSSSALPAGPSNHAPWPWGIFGISAALAALFAAGMIQSRHAPRRRLAFGMCIVVFALGLVLTSCGGAGSSYSPPPTPTGTPKGPATFTVRGTSGSITISTQVTVTVQ